MPTFYNLRTILECLGSGYFQTFYLLGCKKASGDPASSTHGFLAQGLTPALAAGEGSWSVLLVDGMGLSVRAVFFDLDNTLIDTAGASRKGMLEVTASPHL